jgi:hypothetical protein
MQKELPPRILPKVLQASSRLVGAFERLSKPRLQFFYRHAAFQRLGGVLIALCGRADSSGVRGAGLGLWC